MGIKELDGLLCCQMLKGEIDRSSPETGVWFESRLIDSNALGISQILGDVE